MFFKFKNENLLIGRALAFTSGVMAAVSLFDLIPTAFIDLLDIIYVFPSIIITALFIVMGIIFSMFSNRILSNNNYVNKDRLYKTGIFSMITIILHNIPEGVATFLTATTNIKLGISLAIAIALHNIPEGISVSIPIYYSTKSKCKAISYTIVAGISEFLGAIIAFLFFAKFKVDLFLTFLYLIIAGIMLSLVVEELLPTSFRYLKKFSVVVLFIVGFSFMVIVKILL